MSNRRWQPPPLQPSSAEAQSEPKVTVDEKVVRKMLQVNPAMRKGRTTLQVKRALEGGAPLGSAVAPKAASAAAADGPSAAGMDDTLTYFIRGKAQRLREQLGNLADRRRALDAEEAALKAEAREQVRAFVALLDADAFAAFAGPTLAKHADLLRQLGTSATELLDATRHGRK